MTASNSSDDQEKVQARMKRIKRKIVFLFLWTTIGTVMSFSSMVALQTLQTSINIKNNIGAIAMTSAYIASFFYCIFLSPIMIKRLSPSANMIISDLSFIVFCFANFYPEMYILVPGSIISSIGRAIVFPANTIATFNLANQYSKCSSKGENFNANKFQGRFYALFNSVGIIGNLLSYVILYTGSELSTPTSDKEDGLVTQSTAATWTRTPNQRENYSAYYYCGKNDCQDPSIVDENINQYVPPDRTSVYVLVGVTSFLCVVALIIHWFIYPGIGRFRHKLRNIDAEISEILSPQNIDEFAFEEASNKSDIIKVEEKKNYGYENGGYIHDNNVDSLEKSETIEDGNIKKEEKVSDQSEGGYWTTIADTFKFNMRLTAILSNFLSLHYGMLLGFLLSDVTRAYASCVEGVEMTGLIATTFGVAGVLTSIIYGKIVTLVGRNVLMAVIFLLELAVYIACYVWVPDPNTSVVIYFIFIILGLANGLLKPILVVIHSEYFPDNHDIAVNVWNFWVLAGTGLQYGLSSVMCMKDKIYFETASLFAGVICYAGAEFLFQKKARQRKSFEANISISTRL